MVWSLVLSVVSATVLAAVMRGLAFTDGEESRQELRSRARAMADYHVSEWEGVLKTTSLLQPVSSLVNLNTGSSSIIVSPTAVAGVATIEQSVRISNRTITFRDFVGIPSTGGRLYVPTRVEASDNLNGGPQQRHQAAGIPDWLTADLTANPSTLAWAGFSQEAVLEGAQWQAFLSALNLTNSTLLQYEMIVFVVNQDGVPRASNLTWEFWKGNNRIRFAGSANSILRRTLTVAQYRNIFSLGAAPSPSTTVEAVLFDFTALGFPSFELAQGPIRVIARSTSGASAPAIDSIARVDSQEGGTLTGVLHEMGRPVANGEMNAFDTVLVRTVLSMPDNAGSGTADVPLGATSSNIAIYQGTLIPPVTGNYRFRFRTDDGSRLWVDHRNVVSAWWAQGPTTFTSGDVALTANTPVSIWYEWWDWGGMEGRRVEWLRPGGSSTWEVIPDSVLRPGNGTEAVGRGFWSFNDGNSSGWTLQGIRVPGNGNGPLGVPNAAGIVQNQFLGDFGGNNPRPTLRVSNVPPGYIILAFEFRRYGSWDAFNEWGPDVFRVIANGTQVASHNGWLDPTGELSVTMPTHGIRSTSNWHLHRVSWWHDGGDLEIRFTKDNQVGQDINDESFILDNVMVRRVLTGPRP